MPIQVLMPALSPTMTEGKLAKWLKSEGDNVTAGDVLAEIETDKATMEVEAVDEGKLGKILVAEGSEGVAVNTPIALLLQDGEDAADIRAPAPAAKAAAPSPAAGRAGSAVVGQRRRAPRAAAGRRRARGGKRMGRRDQDADRPRRAARCDGRGDAARSVGLPDGRGSRRVPGRLQDQPGPARGVRRAPGHRHPDHRAWLHRPRRRRGLHGAPADRRVHDLQLRHAGDGPDHQFRGQDALHVGRPDGLPDRLPRPERGGGARRGAAFAVLCQLVCALPGPEGGVAVVRGRRQGPAEIRDPRPQPGDLPRERDPLRPQLGSAGRSGLDRPDRQGESGPSRRRT